VIAKIIDIGYKNTASTALIARSNHFEVTIAVATTLATVPRS